MRYFFGNILFELMEKDRSIYVLHGDTGFGIFDRIQKAYPDRIVNIGLMEQSMISIAAGMALQGLRPYVYSITPFLIERAFEQVKIDINAQNVNVKLVGYCDYPNQGVTHNCVDLNIMDAFPNIVQYYPKTELEMRTALYESYNSKKPSFFGLKKYRGVYEDTEPIQLHGSISDDAVQSGLSLLH